MMNDYWSLDSLVEFEALSQRAHSGSLTDEQHRELFATFTAWLYAATEQARRTPITLPAWVCPAHLRETGERYAIAAVFASGVRHGRQIKAETTNYLCNAGQQGHFRGLTQHVVPELQVDPLAVAWLTPAALQANPEALDLAEAFYHTMLAKADKDSDGRPPLLGDFYLTKTGVELVDDLGLREIRLSVTPAGIWLSLIYADGAFCPAWWSPGYDNLGGAMGRRYGWVFRTLMGCLWYDLRVPRLKAFQMREDRARRTGSSKAVLDDKPLILPRVIQQLSWDDGMTHQFQQAGGITAHSVRAHYRKLAEGWQPSERALENADVFGFPEPPDGYTFVQPYTVGDAAAHPQRRVVAKGLQAAKVALARL